VWILEAADRERRVHQLKEMVNNLSIIELSRVDLPPACHFRFSCVIAKQMLGGKRQFTRVLWFGVHAVLACSFFHFSDRSGNERCASSKMLNGRDA
jgi:hypothetical protein